MIPGLRRQLGLSGLTSILQDVSPWPGTMRCVPPRTIRLGVIGTLGCRLNCRYAGGPGPEFGDSLLGIQRELADDQRASTDSSGRQPISPTHVDARLHAKYGLGS